MFFNVVFSDFVLDVTYPVRAAGIDMYADEPILVVVRPAISWMVIFSFCWSSKKKFFTLPDLFHWKYTFQPIYSSENIHFRQFIPLKIHLYHLFPNFRPSSFAHHNSNFHWMEPSAVHLAASSSTSPIPITTIHLHPKWLVLLEQG